MSKTSVLAFLVVVLNGCTSAFLAEPTAGYAPTSPLTDECLSLALKYAPFIFQETDREGGRQDLPSNVDFDGDLRGSNNWDNFTKFKLVPTVYYTAVESETHYFLSYHVFHPRDWSWIRLGVQDQHENDGENLQVVVSKKDGRVKLLYTQAHFKGKIHINDPLSLGVTANEPYGRVRLVDEGGAPSDEGTHVCVFVERMGHGIYSVLDPCANMSRDPAGALSFTCGGGILLRPAGATEVCEEPADWKSGTASYRLESTIEKFWKPLNQLYGDGKLFDTFCTFEYQGARYLIPKCYDGDLYSGPLGNDRGISPFALDTGFCPPTLGSLFVDPAGRYATLLKFQGGWSVRYVKNPVLEHAWTKALK